jgi:hypothetical protein
MHKAGLIRSPSSSFSMTAADLLRNSASFPKQEKEFWTQPISLYELAKLAGFKVPSADKSQLVICYFETSSNLTVYRVNDSAFVPDEYVRWSEKLFEGVKDKMDEPSEPPELKYGNRTGR